MNVFLDGRFAILHGKLPLGFRPHSVNTIPAAPDNHMVGIHRASVIGVQKIAGIDLEREHRPQEPRGIDPSIVIRRKVDGIAHRIQVLAFGGMAQTMAMRIEKGFKGASELTNEVTLPEADVVQFVNLETRDFIGRDETIA